MIPVVYFLLPSKTTACYRAMFDKLNQHRLQMLNPPTIKWKTFIFDFESSLLSMFEIMKNDQSSIIFGIENLNYIGCYFHFCSAIYKWISEHGLIPTYKQENGKFKRFVKLLMSLAFADPQQIPTLFDIFIQDRLLLPQDLYDDDNVQSFLTYFRTKWIEGNNRPGAAFREIYDWLLFWNQSTNDDNIRTTNHVESWHNILIRL
jgi:hypothetical protein